jgi:SM-20-related protein
MSQMPIFIKSNFQTNKNIVRFNLNLPTPPSFQIPKKKIVPNLDIFSLDDLSIDNQVISSNILKTVEEKLNEQIITNHKENNNNHINNNFSLNLTSTQMNNEQQIVQNNNKDKIYNYTKIKDNLEGYQNDFKTSYKIKINDFLNEQFAEYLYNHIIRIPDNQLYIACGIRNTKYEKKLLPQNAKRNQDNINEANKTFGKGEFAYVFHRGMNNVVGEVSQMEIIMRTLLNSNEFKELLSKLTGLEITNLNTMFLSKYKSGHFLSPHSDKGNGKIAFVINLTKNWSPHYGGNLHFLSEDRKCIVETWTPAFNNMVIFYVPPDSQENIGIPHFVGHVNPGIKLSRYAITGWYS